MDRVAVVGAGIVGRATALALARAGEHVVLVGETTARPAASWGNAGHIAVEQVVPLAAPATLRTLHRRLFVRGGPVALPLGQARHWLPFAARLLAASTPARCARGTRALAAMLGQAMPAWRRLADTLGDPGLVDAGGHLVAWESEASAAAGLARWQATETGTAWVGRADDACLARLRTVSPAIAGAARFHGSGQLRDLDRLAHALDVALNAAGVEQVRASARIERLGGGVAVTGVDARRVVIAAGVGSAALMAQAGRPVPLIAERGYHVRADAAGWPADLPPLVFEDRSIIVTRYETQVQVAGFVEFGHADAPADPRKWRRLEAHVAGLGLPIPGPFTRWMGARPTLPDYLPAIGRAAHVDNLYYAFGHQHLGLTLGPLTGELLAALMGGAKPEISLDPFAVERF